MVEGKPLKGKALEKELAALKEQLDEIKKVKA